MSQSVAGCWNIENKLVALKSQLWFLIYNLQPQHLQMFLIKNNTLDSKNTCILTLKVAYILNQWVTED